MTFKSGDMVWVIFSDHSMNFGKLLSCEVAGWVRECNDEFITIDSWRTEDQDAETESFTIGWAMIQFAYKIYIKD